MIGLCLVEFVLSISCVIVVNNSASASRLLIGTDYSYRIIIKNLLIAGLALNYVSNILYLIIFIKYISPLMVKPRQIDYITQIAALLLGTVTNYRFGLICFSRMFPKPEIQVDNSSRLTPINYLAAASVMLDMLPLAAAGLLVYREYPGTNLFMLGLDLMIVIVLVVVVTVWMVAVPKSQEYYASDIKKFNTEFNYRTEEDMNNQKNQSYNKLFSVGSVPNNLEKVNDFSNNDEVAINSVNNNTLILVTADERMQSEEENPPLPAVKSNNVKFDAVSISDIGKVRTSEQDIDEVIRFDNSTLPKKVTGKSREKANPSFV